MREPIKGIVQKVRKKGAWNNLFLIRWLEGPEWNREERHRRVNPQWIEERDIMFGMGHYDILSGYIAMYPEEDEYKRKEVNKVGIVVSHPQLKSLDKIRL